MNLNENTILITGGATGIGLELAKRLISLNNTVIVCGRRAEKLEEAKKICPQLITFQCDLSDPIQRKGLFEFCINNFPQINVLINNAGIQREIDFKSGELGYTSGDNEVQINLEACFHLTALFTPHFILKAQSAIINVSSGLALTPLIITPVYSATKAAMHSFSISLRKQLAKTSIKVFEILPPIVDTDLDRGARDLRGQKNKGISVQKVANEALKGLAKDQYEIPVGLVKLLRIGSRLAPKFFLKMLNK